MKNDRMNKQTRKMALAVLAFVFVPLASQAQSYNCDVNSDGEVDILDVMIVVDQVLNTPAHSQRKLKIHASEEPYTTETGQTRQSVRRAPEVTTSTLTQFYINLMFDDDGFPDMSDGSMTYITESGYYQNEATWPVNAKQNTPVTVYGYHNNEKSCYLDDDDAPYLRVELEENSSEQSDVLVAKETKTWNESQGEIYLKFHHACAAAQFSIKKSAQMAAKGYNVDVNQVLLHNIIKTGDYMLNDFTWKLPEAKANTVTNFTLNAYENGEKANSITLSTDATLLAKDANDYLFLLPTNITSASGNFGTATAGESYMEIKCKIYDDADNYKVGAADGFGSVYLPFSYDLSGYKGKIKSFVINLGTSIRDINGNKIDL